MKPTKLTLLFITALSFVTMAAHGQTPATALDAEADTAVIGQLSRLSPATAQDTSADNLQVTVKNKKFNLALYNAFYNKKKIANFQPEPNIARVMDLPDNEKKVLTLFERFRKNASFLFNVNYKETKDPAQGRIAYSWGSKQYQLRHKPPGEGDNCTYEVHGLDCSGFIYQVFKMSGVELPVEQCRADQERMPGFLHTALEKQYFKGSPFDVMDMGKLKISEMHSGDLMYFIGSKGVYHIAIVLTNEQGEATLYQCLGSPNRETTNTNICVSNMNGKHGILAGKLVPEIEKRNYRIVRILAAD